MEVGNWSKGLYAKIVQFYIKASQPSSEIDESKDTSLSYHEDKDSDIENNKLQSTKKGSCLSFDKNSIFLLSE